MKEIKFGQEQSVGAPGEPRAERSVAVIGRRHGFGDATFRA